MFTFLRLSGARQQPDTAGELSRGPLTPLLLIHGVGHHLFQEIEAAVREALSYQSVAVEPTEFNWDSLVKQHEPDSFLYSGSLFNLGRAFSRAAWIGVEESIDSKALRKALHALWGLLTALVAAWLGAALWWLFALVASLGVAEIPPLRLSLSSTSYLFPPLPVEVMAGSISIATHVVQALTWAVILWAAVLTIFTWTTTRLPFWSAVRTALFRCVWTPIYLLGGAPAFLGVAAVAALLSGLASLFLNLKFTVELADQTTWSVGPSFPELATTLGMTVALIIAAAIAGGLLWVLLKPIFDVVRYLGDPEYFVFIHDKLEEVVASLQPGSRMIMAAHSLGSVIAIDSLLSRPIIWRKFGRVDLVTAGSPLNRMLFRFFPSEYPALRVIVDELAATHERFSWMNVFRRTDFIGGLLPDTRIVNHCLWRNLLRSHGNYWNDQTVISLLVGSLGKMTAISRVEKGSRCITRNTPGPVQPVIGSKAARTSTIFFVVFIAIAGYAGIVWNQFVFTPTKEETNLAEWQRRSTEPVYAHVERAKDVDTATDRRMEFAIIALYYDVRGKRYGAESPPDLFYSTPRYPHVDWEKLDQALKGSSTMTVEVKYAPDQPRIFYVPAYFAAPPYYSAGRFVIYLARGALLAVSWTVWCIVIFWLFWGLTGDNLETPASQLRSKNP